MRIGDGGGKEGEGERWEGLGKGQVGIVHFHIAIVPYITDLCYK